MTINSIRLFNLPLLALALVSLSVWAGDQDDARGFLEDSKWGLLTRTVYDLRDYKHGGRSNGGRNAFKPRNERNGKAEEWGLGFMGTFESGFTRGAIGIGFDAHSYIGIKLDGGGGSVGKARLLNVKNDGHARDYFSRTGGAGKIRISSTVLKYGMQRTRVPIFSSSDTRLLPETNTGFLLISNEISDLTVQAGHFTAGADRNSNGNNNELVINYANPAFKKGNSFDFVGGTYKGVKNLSVSLYTGRYEDNWKTHYVGAYYTVPFAQEQSLTFDLNIYHSSDYGKSYAGDVSNTTWSLMTSYAIAEHRFGIGYQKVDGDTPFDYVNRGSIWIGNASQLSDFNAPREQSWQLRYDVDLSKSVTPGMSFSASYVRGSGIDGTHMDPNGAYTWLGYGKGGKHWERDLTLKYVVQEGKAKGLAFLLRYDVHRSNKAQAELDTDQIRLAIEYPLGGKLL